MFIFVVCCVALFCAGMLYGIKVIIDKLLVCLTTEEDELL